MSARQRISDWPEDERPRERLYRKGPASLADAELLAILLGTGTRGQTALDLARELLSGDGALSKLAGREAGEMKRLKGVGLAKATKLAAAFELSRRLRSRADGGTLSLGSPEAVFARFGPLMEDLKKEEFRVVLLNTQNGYIKDEIVSEGTLSASLVHPREVFRPAIRESAASLILLHNHPSGDPTPSREDVKLTRQLVEAAKLLDLKIHDHVIIGRGRFVSLAQRGLI